MVERTEDPDVSSDEQTHRGEGMGLACSLTEGEREQRRTWVAETLFPHLTSVSADDAALELVFDRSDAALAAVSQFVRDEAACCPFVAYRLLVPAGGGPIQVRITGTGVEAIAEAGFRSLVADHAPPGVTFPE